MSLEIETLPLVDHVGLPASEREALAAAVAQQWTLERVVHWGLDQRPPRLVTEVINQDEYTQDVVLPLSEQRYLVYDCS